MLNKMPKNIIGWTIKQFALTLLAAVTFAKHAKVGIQIHTAVHYNVQFLCYHLTLLISVLATET